MSVAQHGVPGREQDGNCGSTCVAESNGYRELALSACATLLNQIGHITLCLQLAYAVGVELLEKDDPVYEWRERLFKEFDETISKNGKYRETST